MEKRKMFRNKEFLIEQGMYKGCREDTFYLVGAMYDEVRGTGKIDRGRYEELREYLENHRDTILKGGQYSISQYESIYNRFKESFDWFKKEKIIKVEKKKEVDDLVKDEDIGKCTGIYGIYVDNRLVYIGRTISGFKERYNQHMLKIKHEDDSFLYRSLINYKKAGKSITFKPLIILERLQMENKKVINVKELNCMELALITVLQPELNVEGKLKPYVFRNY